MDVNGGKKGKFGGVINRIVKKVLIFIKRLQNVTFCVMMSKKLAFPFKTYEKGAFYGI